MDTRELLIAASKRAEEMSNQIEDTDAFVSALGLADKKVVQDFCTEHSINSLELGIMMHRLAGMDDLDIVDAMSVTMLFGIAIGYQIALIREESDE